MKKFTIGFIIFLLVSFCGMILFVNSSPDFVGPVKFIEQEGISEDNPIWNKTMDDMAQYLIEEGIIENDEYGKLSDGIATEARLYSDIELYWWDVNNLDENSDEYVAYKSAIENGSIDLWGSGNIMQVTVRGPFAIGYYGNYKGDPDKLLDVFSKYCSE